MCSENSKISDHYRLVISFTNKVKLKRSNKYVVWSSLISTIYGKL